MDSVSDWSLHHDTDRDTDDKLDMEFFRATGCGQVASSYFVRVFTYAVAEEQLAKALEGSVVIIHAKDDLFNINATIAKSLTTSIAKYCPNDSVSDRSLHHDTEWDTDGELEMEFFRATGWGHATPAYQPPILIQVNAIVNVNTINIVVGGNRTTSHTSANSTPGGSDSGRSNVDQPQNGGGGRSPRFVPIYLDSSLGYLFDDSVALELVGEVDLMHCDSWSKLFRRIHEVYCEYRADPGERPLVFDRYNSWPRRLVFCDASGDRPVSFLTAWETAKLEIVRIRLSIYQAGVHVLRNSDSEYSTMPEGGSVFKNGDKERSDDSISSAFGIMTILEGR